MHSSRTRTPRTRSPSITTFAGALTRTSLPRCFEPRARRLGIQLVERHRRQHQRRRRRIRTEHALEHADEMRRLRLIDRLIERRQRERLPEQLAQSRRLAVLLEPLREPTRACLAVAASAASRIAAAEPIRSTDNRSRQLSASHASTPARKCSGDGNAGSASTL